MIGSGVNVPTYSPEYRASGILLHITSLPSPYGVGDLGSAFSWVDRLDHAGQSCWQALPLGPTGYGNSPYQPLSSFAGNVLVISPDWLIDDELLAASDCEHAPFPFAVVDYDAVIPFKDHLLQRTWENFRAGARPDLRPAYEQYCDSQAYWLEDYALFRALKAKFGGAPYLEWPNELVRRKQAALDQMRHELADNIGRVRFAQFLLFRQADRLKAHAQSKGLKLIGDLPFFVSRDSSDVWANPELFLLDGGLQPRAVAGVPPDYFSAQGQLWGNPLYDWDALRESGYRWWIDRLRSLLTHVDVIRLDHFRGFTAAWHVPADAPTAQSGKWMPGPGAEFLRAIERELGNLPFIAEDNALPWVVRIWPQCVVGRDKFRYIHQFGGISRLAGGGIDVHLSPRQDLDPQTTLGGAASNRWGAAEIAVTPSHTSCGCDVAVAR